MKTEWKKFISTYITSSSDMFLLHQHISLPCHPRTPFSRYKRVLHSNFKSPVSRPRLCLTHTYSCCSVTAVCFCTSQLQVCGSAKVSPAEEAAELERRREQLDMEIAQLEAEWVQLRLWGLALTQWVEQWWIRTQLPLHFPLLHNWYK